MKESLRKSGIDIIGDVPWGTHFCQFYQTREDLIDILVPYFKAGLENNELCVWITSHPPEVEEAKEALRKAVPGIDVYLEKGQMKIVPHTHGYLKKGTFDPDRVVNSWIEKIGYAMARGYDGLRAVGDNRWLEKEGWNGFIDYENKVDAIIDKHHVIALCPYDLDMCSATEIIEVVSIHQFALIKREGKWERIENSGRQRAEEALQVSEARYRSLYENSLDGILLTKPDGIILSANPEACHMFGMTEDEIKQVGREGAVVNDENLTAALKERKRTGRLRAELTHRRKDGSTFVCDTTSQLFTDADGGTSTCLIIRDITERKRAEEALCRERSLLESVMQATDVMLVFLDPQFNFVWVNPAYAETCQMEPEEMVGRNHFDLYPHAENEAIFRHVRDTGEGVFFKDKPFIFPDQPKRGVTYWDWSLAPVKDSDGNVTGLVFSLRETTKHKLAEEALRESESRLKLAQVSAGAGIWDWNMSTGKLEWSEELFQLFGLDPRKTDASFDSWRSVLHPNDRLIVESRIETAINNRTSLASEYRIVLPSEIRWINALGSTTYDSGGKPQRMSGICIDITERKLAEEEVQSARNMLQLIMNNIPQGIFWKDRNSRYMGCNKVFAKAAGLESPESIVGKTDYELPWLPEQTRWFREYDRKVMENDTPEYHIVEPQQEAEGKLAWIETNKIPLHDAKGNVIGLLGTYEDITERMRAERALQESEEKFRGLVEQVNDWVWEIDTDCVYTYASPRARELLGYDPADLLGTTLFDYMTSEEADRVRSLSYPIFNERKEFFLLENTLIRKDGGTVTVETSGVPIYNSQGNFSGYRGIDRDTTERKKAEEALRLSNLYNRSLIEASLDPLVTIGRDGKIMDVNGATEQVTGYSRSELIGTDFSDYFTEPEKARAGYKQAFMDSEVRDYPLEIQHKEGRITSVLYNASVYRDENGKIIGVFAAARDITESIKAKEKIQTLANAVESSDDAIITKSLDGIITSWNKGAEKVYGYSAEEVVEKPISILEPDDRKGEIKLFSEKISQGEKVQHYETSRLKKDSTIISVSVTLSPIFDSSGKLVAVSTIARDITERKKANEALRLSNLYNRSLIESSLDPLVTIGPDGKITDVNAATEIATGYSRDELIGTDFSNYFTDPEKAKKGYQQVFKEGSVFDYELEIQNRNGSIIPVLYNASVYKEESGKVIGVFAAARDITESKKAEKALKKAYDSLEEKVKERTDELEEAYKSLKESEKGLSEAQRMAHIGNWEWNLLTGRMRWSDEMYRIFERDSQEPLATYTGLLNYIHPDDRDYVKNASKKVLKGTPIDIDHRIVLDNGEERIVHAQAEVVLDEENRPIQLNGIVQDITERKRTEEKIKILANAVESSNDAIATLSLEGIVISWNKGAEQIYGYSAEEILGKSISITEPDNLKGQIEYFSEKIKHGEKSQSYETLRLKKDGTTINISAALSPVFNASGELVAILAIARDITERIKTEEAMAEIDKIQIKEIHHRIKNNLQVISSLLDLQAERFRNKEVLEAFRESQNRVTSMSLIHEELYKSEGKDKLNFSTYLLKLAESLFQTYSLSSKNVRFCMDLEENTFFDMDIAVPLGIIINELISNSLKHAFTQSEEGEIRVQLHREEKNDKIQESLFSLTISDNGKGIPENIDLESLESLGLQLVNALVDQLDGNIELKRANGTEFRISFNVTERS